MTQPTDRLGQPLSVGDWVVTSKSNVVIKAYAGKTFEVSGFCLDDGLPCVIIDKTASGNRVISYCSLVTKINPKPETTTWDKCVFVPEGVTCQ